MKADTDMSECMGRKGERMAEGERKKGGRGLKCATKPC